MTELTWEESPPSTQQQATNLNTMNAKTIKISSFFDWAALILYLKNPTF